MANILVVDDELGIRELLSEILGDEGHTVELAENAAQARAARLREQPDVVLLDIWMPDTDGVSLLKEWANNRLLTMPVIMMSGHGTIDTAVEATRLGAKNFLEKPISLQKLFTAVRQALEGESIAVMPRAAIHVTQHPIHAQPAHAAAHSAMHSISTHYVAAQYVAAPVPSQIQTHASQQGEAHAISRPAGIRQLPMGIVPAPVTASPDHAGHHVAMSGNGVAQIGLHSGGSYHIAPQRSIPMPTAHPHAADVVLSVPATQMRYMPVAGPLHLSEATHSGSVSSEHRGEQSFRLDGLLRDVRDQFERAYFEYHLMRERGSMTRVAEKSGLERTHLYRKLKQLGVDISGSRRPR